jgi:hypothetical protein
MVDWLFLLFTAAVLSVSDSWINIIMKMTGCGWPGLVVGSVIAAESSFFESAFLGSVFHHVGIRYEYLNRSRTFLNSF